MGSQSQHDQATEKQQLVFTLVFSCLELAENRQGCILSPCLFNLYAEYIMRNAGLDEVQAGLDKAEEPETKHQLDLKKGKGIPEKHLLLLH